MKKLNYLWLFLLAIAILFTAMPATVAATGGVPIDESNFPDPVFRQHVLDFIDVNGDAVLQQEECDAVGYLDLEKDPDAAEDAKVHDLTGMEHFTEMFALNISYNSVSSIDLSPFPNLVSISCSHNPIKTLDFSHNPNLSTIGANNCELEDIDISMLSFCNYLDVENNHIRELDLSQNFDMEFLNVNKNELDALELSHLNGLIEVEANGNNIKKIDVSQSERVTILDLSNNPLTELELGDYCNFEELYLSNFDIASLDLSKCTKLKRLSVCYPKLIDNNTSALKELKLPQTDTLIVLNLHNNYSLTSVDLSPYDNLEYFYFSGCKNCEPLDFTQTPKLKELQLSDLPYWPNYIQVDQCPDLEELWIQYSKYLGRVDLTQNPKLKKLSFFNSNVYYVDVSQNPELEFIDLSRTSLFCFDLSHNPNIDFSKSKFGGYEYPIGLDENSECDLGALPMGPIFDPARVSNLTGASLEGKVLQVDPDAPAGQQPVGHVIDYDYDCGQGHTQHFRLRVVEREEQEPEPTTEAPTEPPTEAPTEPPTEPSTEPPTEAPTEPPTEPSTEPPTEPSTEPPTEAPTEPPTELPTEPTTKPTEVPTEAPTVPSSESEQVPSTGESPTSIFWGLSIIILMSFAFVSLLKRRHT